jgi:plasmid stabilization system protein ParE
MTHEVVLQRLAKQDLQEAYHWAAAQAPHAALRWLDRFAAAIATLSTEPQRRPLAPENGKVDVELREFLFGKRPYVFRVIFTIDAQTVRVLRIRRAQNRGISRAELERALDWDV